MNKIEKKSLKNHNSRKIDNRKCNQKTVKHWNADNYCLQQA